MSDIYKDIEMQPTNAHQPAAIKDEKPQT